MPSNSSKMLRIRVKMYNLIRFIISLTFIIEINCELLKLQNGAINGTTGKSRNGRLYREFYAIPYAEPPVGELRFKDPVAAKPWTDVRDATKPSAKCIQPDTHLSRGPASNKKEDCLYLNVFVPNDIFKPSCKAAVIVWIHGGSFLIGSGTDYSPRNFMDKDVIVVTINYRLGVLGFLGLNDDIISGNFGLKDQALAIQWVKQNIAAFGGDPQNITLMGESAGAASVHLHMFSPLSKGLFQKTILQSGSAFALWASDNEGYGEAISTSFLIVSGCFRNDSAKVLKCLQSLPALDFISMVDRLYVRNARDAHILFKPMIESNVKNRPFLPRKPAKNSYQSMVPWIAGITSGEGAMRVAMNAAQFANITKVTQDTIVLLLWPYLYSLEPEIFNQTATKIIDFYFGSKDNGTNKLQKFVDIVTDFGFLYSFINVVKSGRDRQYAYYYDHRGSSSTQDFANLTTDLGVAHADELYLLFGKAILEAKWTPQDKLVSETLIKFWTNFAIFGDPNGQSGEKLWKPTSPEGDIDYLHIKSNSTTMEKNLLKEKYEFWDSLPH